MNKKPKIFIFLSSLVALFYSAAVLPEEQLKFDHISERDGLASQVQYNIVQDKNDFIWFAGETGLQRYDGNDLISFTHNPSDKHSISDNRIRYLLADQKGDLWAGTENGLSIYHYDEERFSQFDFKLDGDDEIKASKIRKIYQDSKGVLWIGSYYGLTKYDPHTQEHANYKHHAVTAIHEYSSNTLLIGTHRQGLYKFDINTGIFTELNNAPVSNDMQAYPSLSKTSIVDIFKNLEGEYFVGSWGSGILKLDVENETIIKLDIALPSHYIHKITQEANGLYWIGTARGLAIYNKETNKSKIIESLVATSGEAKVSSVRDIYINGNEVWLATWGDGVFYFDTSRRQFQYYGLHSDKNEGLTEKVVDIIVEAANNDIYISTENGRISKFNAQTKKFSHFEIRNNDEKIVSSVSAMFVLNEHEMLVDMNNLIYRFDTEKKYQDISRSRQFGFINQFGFIRHCGSKEIPFVGLKNTDNALAIFELGPNKSILLKHSIETNLSSVSACTTSQNGDLFVSDHAGHIIKLIDINSHKPTVETVRYSDDTFSQKILYVDELGAILMSSVNKGLVVINNKKLLDLVEQAPLLKQSHIMSMLWDKDSQSIWVSSYHGLFKIDLATYSVINFDKNDGLQDNEFKGAALKASDGSMYFGGINGFNRFFPNDVKPVAKVPDAKITNLYISGKPMSVQSDNTLLARSILNTKNINLDYQYNAFGFGFSAFSVFNQNKIQYAYTLDGYDNDWQYADYKNRCVSYANIPPGNYTFRVKAQNKNGIWNEQDASITVSIAAPLWRTAPAYIAYTIIIALLFYAIIIYRLRTLSKRAAVLEKQVTERTFEVEQLLDKRNQELANVSHEFRTPLTLILGPVRQLLSRNIDKAHNDWLNIIQSNAYRLLRMVDQLLNMEASQAKAITQKAPQAFAETVVLIVEAFSELAKEKNINLSIQQLEKVYFDFAPDAFEKIMLNLLSNAIKYTPPNGSITVASSRVNKDLLKIVVSDSGIGIAQDKQSSIFERFHRAIENDQERIVGAGIGLALVSELVSAHGGYIRLDSKPNQGATFIIYLPVFNEVSVDHVDLHAHDDMIAMELMSITSQATGAKYKTDKKNINNGDKSSILIVEDNPDMLSYITESLQVQYSISTARNGEEGLQVAIDEIPDIIISDIMMPKKDGYQMTQSLRQHQLTNHIPIILLTARGDRISRLKGWQNNADEYLTKPFDIEELHVRLKNILDIRNILKKRFSDTVFNHPKLSQTSQANGHDQTEQSLLFLTKLDQVLEKIYSHSDIKINHIAEQIFLSERQLSRKLKSIVDVSPGEYLRRFRLSKAAEQLKSGKKASDVCWEVGFTSLSHFGKCFKAQYKCSPSEYKKNSA